MSNPIISRSLTIGNIAAEADDDFLFHCFIDNEALAEAKDAKSPKMIILGSTGAGKTALLRMLEKDGGDVFSVELDEVSLNYISNSDVINFLMELDVPLDHFFQALWKHVIISEYIKLRYNVNDRAKSNTVFGRFFEAFRLDSSRRRALDYLEKWKDKFWVEFDETVRDLTKSLEDQISGNFSAELEKFRSDAGFSRKLGDERRSHLQQRLKRFVDSDLLSEMSRVISLLADYDDNSMRPAYVIIDRLDEDWVSPKIKFQLIRSLIEALKGLRRISGLKIVVSLRSDLMEKVIFDTRERGFQSEKYEDYIFRIFWNTDQLKDLVNKRINLLYRKKYTKENVFFEDIFSEKIDKVKTFKYLVERTMNRPRDIISFVNLCLSEANGKSIVSKSEVVKAERSYSENRRAALVDEWRSVFSAIEPTLGMIKGKRAYFPLYELNTSDFFDRAVTLFFEKEAYSSDPIVKFLDQLTSYSTDDATPRLISAIFERLYLVGAVGINPSPETPVQWFFRTQRRLDQSSFGLEAKVRIHPMLHSALEIRS